MKSLAFWEKQSQERQSMTLHDDRPPHRISSSSNESIDCSAFICFGLIPRIARGLLMKYPRVVIGHESAM